MAEASRRAAAKPARGGLGNVLFLQASLETLGQELTGIADAITVNYPWGSLLRAVALPEPFLLAKLADVAKPSAALDILVNMQPLRDAALAVRLGLEDAALTKDLARLRGLYAGAGLAVRSIDDVTGRLIHATRWGSQLHFAGREVLRLHVTKRA
jgi:16S rRNA (adenine(1408)-N(1))-methyltransferase